MTRFALLLILFTAACSQTTDRVFAPGARGWGTEDQLTIGRRMMDAGEYELALRAFTRAAAQKGTTTEILGEVGFANLALGRVGQAEEILRKATDAEDATPIMWNNLGVALMEKGEIPEAVLVFRRAFATSSGQSDAIRDNLAKALALRDDPNYDGDNDDGPKMIRQGRGNVLLVTR